jgi:diaminopimelate decarboxylase
VVPLLRGRGLEIILEPGRTIAANAGILVSRVLYTKTGGSRHFAVVDTGMHHLLRPSLYGAFHFVWPVRVDERHVPPRRARDLDLAGLESTDVVGPICETADVLAKGRLLPPVRRGDLLAIFTAGAYGMSMASNYNGVPRPPEVLVQGDRATLIRRRETYQDLVGPEEVEDSLALTRPAGLANGNGS